MKSNKEAIDILGRLLTRELEDQGLVVVSKSDAELIERYRHLCDEDETRG